MLLQALAEACRDVRRTFSKESGGEAGGDSLVSGGKGAWGCQEGRLFRAPPAHAALTRPREQGSWSPSPDVLGPGRTSPGSAASSAASLSVSYPQRLGHPPFALLPCTPWASLPYSPLPTGLSTTAISGASQPLRVRQELHPSSASVPHR